MCSDAKLEFLDKQENREIEKLRKELFLYWIDEPWQLHKVLYIGKLED